MATTTNFGWETPDDTDLVKDGALAMRTLGNSIDTSFVDLKGGTTGQVLSKASNTDLDFTWVAVDPLTILDAKGDLISATAADTPARLAVGTNGQVLTADSTTSTGLKWATAASGGMTLISTTTLSSTSTSITVNSGYNTLLLIVSGINQSSNGVTTIKVNNGTTGFYGNARWGKPNTSPRVYGDEGYSNETIPLYFGNEIGSGQTVNSFAVTIQQPDSTSYYKPVSVYGQYRINGGDYHTGTVGGAWTSTSAITSLVFVPSAGSFSGGTVLLYGVK
jgi:hypothetical protein